MGHINKRDFSVFYWIAILILIPVVIKVVFWLAVAGLTVILIYRLVG